MNTTDQTYLKDNLSELAYELLEQTKFMTMPRQLQDSLLQELLPPWYRFVVLNSPMPPEEVLSKILNHPRYAANLANATTEAVDWLGITTKTALSQYLHLKVAEILQGIAEATTTTNDMCAAENLPCLPAMYFHTLEARQRTNLHEGLVAYAHTASWANKVDWEKIYG